MYQILTLSQIANLIIGSDMSEIFDLSSNALTGIIPSELSKFRGVVRLSGNTDL